MKIKYPFLSLFFAATAVAFLSSCSGNTKEDATESRKSHEVHGEEQHTSGSNKTPEASEPQFQVDAQFQKQLSTFFTSYVNLHEAFVSSDAKNVQQEAKETNRALARVDMKLLTGAAHNDWMNYLAPMQASLKAIQSGEEIEAQRKSFSTLSDHLYKSVKAFGLGGEKAFYTFCPMAFNDEGASWLSDEAKVRNPYFGEKMLACGEVKEELK